MAIHDFTSERLFLDADLAAGVAGGRDPRAARTISRTCCGSSDGSLHSRVQRPRRRMARAPRHFGQALLVSRAVQEKVREQQGGPDLRYLFAPLKRARLDYMVQKATEMGVARLSPVHHAPHTVAERVNIERMKANVIEAAEQCGSAPRAGRRRTAEARRACSARWDAGCTLIYLRRRAPSAPARPRRWVVSSPGRSPCSSVPRAASPKRSATLILRQPFARAISLGPAHHAGGYGRGRGAGLG